jgi:hypothetical protein
MPISIEHRFACISGSFDRRRVRDCDRADLGAIVWALDQVGHSCIAGRDAAAPWREA